jgi:hypothetical protein
MKCGTFRLSGCFAAACFWSLGSIGLSAQTVDIGDFLVLDAGNSWAMEGKASLVYSGMSLTPDITATITTLPGAILHKAQTNKMVLQASGDAGNILFPVLFSVVQTLQLRLDSTGLYLHSRDGVVYLNGATLDWDQEVYKTPAKILPRLITVGNSYPFTADLTTGEVPDKVVVDKIETVETALGPVEAIKLILFSDGETPVVLWLGRNIGAVKTQVDTSLSGNPLGLYAILTGTSLPWETASVNTKWAGTINEGDGWRSAESLGSFWVPDPDSPWMGHHGFSWAYTQGDLTNLWIYLPGVGWFWTSSEFYPFMYSDTHSEILFYFDLPGSHLFWSYKLDDFLDLGQGG